MNVFVLTTGRSGSTTLSAALQHVTNFSCSHESRSELVGKHRLDYPQNHIEIDHRLAWFLGELGNRYGDEACYVHLVREREATASSWNRRWHPSMRRYRRAPREFLKELRRRVSSNPVEPRLLPAFASGLILRSKWFADDRLDVARYLVDTVNWNIEEFVSHRPKKYVLHLETSQDELPGLWEYCGFQGDLESALAELAKRHNASRQQ